MATMVVNDGTCVGFVIVTVRARRTLVWPLHFGDLVPRQCFFVVLLVDCVCQLELVSQRERHIDFTRGNDVVKA